MKKFKKLITLGLIVTVVAGMMTGCGAGTDSTSGQAEGTDGVTKVTVGYASNAYPLAYQDEAGNFTGYELEVLKEADQRLENYEFEYVEGAQDALYAGLGTGKYDLVVTNAFYTDERAENYILPENPLGASLVGIVLKKDVSGIATFEDAAKADLSLAPILAGDGLYFVVAKYNESNPDNQIELTATDSATSFMDSIGWVAEGRYDFAAWPKNYWEQVVKAEDGSLHEYYDQLQFVECRSVYTYPVIAKGQEQLAEELNSVLGDLYHEGLLEKLSNQFYGYNAFQYAEEEIGTSSEKTEDDAESGEIESILISYTSNSFPIAYQDEDGNLTGYELEVLKEADKRLEKYEFEYTENGFDAAYAGLGTGQLDMVVSNAFYTTKRAESYILTENPIGASVVGLILTKDEADVKTLDEAASKGLSLAPIQAGNGLHYVITKYNEEHPDNQLELISTDSNDAYMDCVRFVQEGRYDFAVWEKASWGEIVEDEEGALHELYDALVFNESESVYTYPVIAKGNEEFADALNGVLGELYQDGTLTRISEQFYGYDVFEYVE